MSLKIERRAVYFFLFLLSIFTYWRLSNTFFQQDEWQFFGVYIHALSSSSPLANIVLPFGGQLTHFYPLSNLLFLLEYLLFKMNFAPYAWVAIFLHFLNGVLVYELVHGLTKKNLVAFLSSIFFLTSRISHQALTWILVSPANLPATFFLLFSFFFFVYYLDLRKQRLFLVSLFFLVTSLFFKEVSVFLFIFYPLFLLSAFLLTGKSNLNELKRSFILIAISFAVYVGLRFLFLLTNFRSQQPEIGDVSAAPIGTYILRLIFVPLKGVSQSFIWQDLLIKLSERIIRFGYPQFVERDGSVNPYLAQSVVLDLAAYLSTVIMFLSIFLLFKFLLRCKEKQLARSLHTFSLFFITSFLPFVFIPGRAGYFSIFEPRNLYVPVIASSFITAVFFYAISRYFTGKFASLVLFGLIALLVIVNIGGIESDIKSLEQVGNTRRSLLTKIKTDYPKLPRKAIIFTRSDRPYYGMPEDEKILPIQSGFGRMVLVWYQEDETFPGCLYENQFLHDLLSQGYKFCDGRGFGYFRDYAKLIREVRINNLEPENIIGYQWDGASETFSQITLELRKEVKKELTDESEKPKS